MNQLCKVCGEPAAGYHFGAFTCEGCKSFFGRTYNNLSTIGDCKNNNQCVINKKNRTSCKSCRLKKCLMVGMSKSGSRYGRRSNWFKIHCLIQDQAEMNNRLAEQGVTNGSSQINQSFNENKDLINQFKSEASLNDVTKTSNLNNNNNNNNNNNINNNNNHNNNNINNNYNNNNKLHNITNHSNNVSNNHNSSGLSLSSNGSGPSPTSIGSNDGSSGGRPSLSSPYSSLFEAAAKVSGFPASAFDPLNPFLTSLQQHAAVADSKAGLKLINGAAAAAAAAAAASGQHPHHPNTTSSSSLGNSTTSLTTSTSSPTSQAVAAAAASLTNSHLTYPFHHHPHPSLPISPIAPLSPLDPSSRFLFQSAAQLFGKTLNGLPKYLNGDFLTSAYNSRLLPFQPINPVNITKLSPSSTAASPHHHHHHHHHIKGSPPSSPCDLAYANEVPEQEKPIDLSRKSISNKLGCDDDADDDELCCNDDNNNATGESGEEVNKSCMIGDHDSGFSPSSNEDMMMITTPLDLTAKRATPSPSPPPQSAATPPTMTRACPSSGLARPTPMIVTPSNGTPTPLVKCEPEDEIEDDDKILVDDKSDDSK